MGGGCLNKWEGWVGVGRGGHFDKIKRKVLLGNLEIFLKKIKLEGTLIKDPRVRE